jgi:hypothetical protein
MYFDLYLNIIEHSTNLTSQAENTESRIEDSKS